MKLLVTPFSPGFVQLDCPLFTLTITCYSIELLPRLLVKGQFQSVLTFGNKERC
jgi:hypothetical protein